MVLISMTTVALETTTPAMDRLSRGRYSPEHSQNLPQTSRFCPLMICPADILRSATQLHVQRTLTSGGSACREPYNFGRLSAVLRNHNRLNQQIQGLAGLDANFVVTLQLFEGSFEMDAGSRMVALHGMFSPSPLGNYAAPTLNRSQKHVIDFDSKISKASAC